MAVRLGLGSDDLSLSIATMARITVSVLALLWLAQPGMAQSLPSGGTVASGSVTIGTPSAGNLLITQTSQYGIVNWDSFSIGAGYGVQVNNGSGATLNRVTGALPSSIDGSLSATGSLYLINPAGVMVGSGGLVRTGGSFLAATHAMSDADFLDGGAMVLTGTSQASVSNAGLIAALDGDVVLTARRVVNTGTLLAPQGSVGLLAGYEVLLRDTSHADGKFAVRLGGDDTEVVNSGTIEAANAELRANGGNVYALAGNTDGVIKATGVAQQGGRIFLTADGGKVTATQRLVATPPRTAPVPAPRPMDRDGGVIRISADQVTLGGAIDVSGDNAPGGTIIAMARTQLELNEDARLDASGSSGGLILLGGDFQGGKSAANNYWDAPLGTTAQTLVAAGASITANGATGAGGNVVVWSDHYTGFAGAISATGATSGGAAEVSGKAHLGFTGTADLRGAGGSAGTLLLDPYDVVIREAPPFGGGTIVNGVFVPSGGSSVLSLTQLFNSLMNSAVTVSTGGAIVGGQFGDITLDLNNIPGHAFNEAFHELTLSAYGDIIIQASVATSGLNTAIGNVDLVLRADNFGTGMGTVKLGGALSNFSVDGNISIYANNSQSGGSISVNPDKYVDLTNYSTMFTAGGTLTSYTLVNTVFDLQNMQNNLGANYALSRNIDAAATAGWNGDLGFAPVGSDATPFTGTLTGLGHVVKNLTINPPATSQIGLVGVLGANGIIRNIGLEDVTIRGLNNVGGLVGQSIGGITQSYATGAVDGTYYVGGLVGQQSSGSINQSYATSAVSGQFFVGGLVGEHGSGSITQSYATGALVSGAGGLVGERGTGAITDSYFDMDTTGASGAFGLTTADLQSGLPAGFDPAVWGILPDASYPYLLWRFPDGPSIISGRAIDINGGNDRLGVGLAIDGNIIASGYTGANGYYNFMVDPVLADNSALIWLTGRRFGSGSITVRANAVGEMPGLIAPGFGHSVASGLDLYADTVNIKTGLTTFTDISFMMDRALYGSSSTSVADQLQTPAVLLYQTGCGCGGVIDVGFIPGMPDLRQTSARIDASAALLTWDYFSTLLPLNLTILAAHDVDLTGVIIAENDLAMTAGGNLILNPLTLISAGDQMQLAVAGNLTVGLDAILVASTLDITIAGDTALHGTLDPSVPAQIFAHTIRLNAEGDVTLKPDARLLTTGSGDALQIAVGGLFDNQAGADALVLYANSADPDSARWLIYLNSPADAHRFGDLDSRNTAIWNAAAFSPVNAAGSRYAFAYQPIVTVTANNATKIYGETGTPFTYGVTGMMEGVAGAYLGDTISGAPQLISAGAPANAAGGSYVITVTQGTLDLGTNGVRYVNGLLTVTPLPVTTAPPGQMPRELAGQQHGVFFGWEDDGQCSAGVLGPDCATLPYPGNRLPAGAAS